MIQRIIITLIVFDILLGIINWRKLAMTVNDDNQRIGGVAPKDDKTVFKGSETVFPNTAPPEGTDPPLPSPRNQASSSPESRESSPES